MSNGFLIFVGSVLLSFYVPLSYYVFLSLCLMSNVFLIFVGRQLNEFIWILELEDNLRKGRPFLKHWPSLCLSLYCLSLYCLSLFCLSLYCLSLCCLSVSIYLSSNIDRRSLLLTWLQIETDKTGRREGKITKLKREKMNKEKDRETIERKTERQ